MSHRREDVNLRLDSRQRAVDCIGGMSHKSDRIAALAKPFEGRNLDARYLGYFECFNRQRFFEAHEVLEELWLPQRAGPNGAFYKGLIQLAGAFVHVQNSRLGPALALFKLAQTNLRRFPATHEGLDLGSVLTLIEHWMRKLVSAGAAGERCSGNAVEPQLPLPTEQMHERGSAA